MISPSPMILVCMFEGGWAHKQGPSNDSRRVRKQNRNRFKGQNILFDSGATHVAPLV